MDCLFLQVVSGDLVSDVPLGAVAATHRRHDAVVTTMLCPAPVSGPSESGSSVGKDKTKKPGRYDIIGLDPSKQFLLYIATGLLLIYFYASFCPLLLLTFVHVFRPLGVIFNTITHFFHKKSFCLPLPLHG